MPTSRHYRGSQRRLTETLGTTMYVVDTGLLQANLIEMIVNQFDFAYTRLESHAELLHAIRVQPLPMDLLVVDLSLQNNPGLELVEEIRRHARESGVLLMQAIPREETELGFSLAVYAHTPRPMELGEFNFGIGPAG